MEDRGYFLYHKNLSTGEEKCTNLAFEGGVGTESSSAIITALIALDNDRALLCAPGIETQCVDTSGNIIGETNFVLNGDAVYFRVSGAIYVRTEANETAPLDINTLTLGTPLSAELSGTYSSNAGDIHIPVDGGEPEHLFAWLDAALSTDTNGSYVRFENSRGEFFFPHAPDKLVKVTRKLIPEKKTLTLACFIDSTSENYEWADTGYFASRELLDAVIRFNNTDGEYKVEIKPLVYDGTGAQSRAHRTRYGG